MRNLVLSGGPYHSFASSSAALAELLDRDGFSSWITTDVEGGLEFLGEFELLTLNLLRWTMSDARFDAERDRWSLSLSGAGRAAIVRHLSLGRGLLGLHTASICFDDWPEWVDILGARWDWGRSSHPPSRPSRVAVRSGAHPVVDGATDFDVFDEIYSDLTLTEGVEPLMTSPRRGVDQPLLLARAVGPGRVVYDALGHDAASIIQPAHAQVIRGAAAWAAKCLEEPD